MIKTLIPSKSVILAAFLLFASLAVPQASEAQTTLANFSFTTDIIGASSPGINTSVDFSRVSLYSIGSDGFGNVLQTYPYFLSTSAASALSLDTYWSLTLSSNTSFINLAALSYEVGKGGSADPRGYIVRSSVDGFSTDLFAETLPSGPNTTPAPRSLSLSGSAYQNLNTVTFHFYVYTPSLDRSVDWRNVSVTGTTSPLPATPEPGTLAFIALGLAVSISVCRKKS